MLLIYTCTICICKQTYESSEDRICSCGWLNRLYDRLMKTGPLLNQVNCTWIDWNLMKCELIDEISVKWKIIECDFLKDVWHMWNRYATDLTYIFTHSVSRHYKVVNPSPYLNTCLQLMCYEYYSSHDPSGKRAA